MPHKHRRKPLDPPSHDLPPTSFAKPLPVGKAGPTRPRDDSTKARKRKRNPGNTKALEDDTPREFQRLMAIGAARKRAHTLHDGALQSSKKRRLGQTGAPAAKSSGDAIKKDSEPLKIRPRERFVDFSSRVDQALPVAGLNRKGKNTSEIKDKQSRLEKKIQRMQTAWRVDEARRKEKEEDATDALEEENALHGIGEPDLKAPRKGSRRSKAKHRENGEDAEDDPWAKLKEMRGQRIAVYDVAKGPPSFKRMPKDTFKIKDNAKVDVGSVPAAAGSLRRREELNSARRDVVESYRKMMKDRRGPV